jgi:cytochrome c-type biogenesis protein CcmE
MKKFQIIGLLIIAAAIAVIATNFKKDISTYTNFSKASEAAQAGNESDFHVVGELRKDAEGKILDTFYDPVVDPNRFEFVLLDENKRAQRVIYSGPKPSDMDKSEKVVIIGRMQGDVFRCNKILLKCPSKYNGEKVEFKEVQKS